MRIMYVHFIQKDFPDTVVDFNGVAGLKNTPPIIAGNNNSAMVGGGSTKTVPFQALTPGGENHGFTIEAWIAPLTGAEVYAFNHANASIRWADGIHFTVLIDGTPVTITYETDTLKAFHVVGVYSRYSMALYVDGAMVVSSDLESPNAAGWVSDTDVVIGEGVGRAVVDGVAFYRRELQAQTVQDHYLMGTTIPAITTNLSALSSTIYNFEDQAPYLISRSVWPEWSPGSGAGVDIVDNVIYSETGGSWQTFIPLSDYQVIQRGEIAWRFDGAVTVEISKDAGVTWVPANNNSYIPGVQGASPMTLDIKVTLGADSTLHFLEVELYDSLAYETQLSDGAATYENGNIVSADKPYNQLEYRHNRGARLEGTSSIVITPDPAGDPISAIDMWVKPAALGVGTVFQFSTGEFMNTTTNSGGTLLLNGAGSYALESDEWINVMYKLTVPSHGSITLGDGFTGAIGNFTAYRESVVGQEQRIYRSYFGGQKAEVAEPQSIVIDESADSWDLYSYTWTNVGS